MVRIGENEAAQVNEQALAEDPKMAQAHVNLIYSRGALGDYEATERHYRRAVELGADDPELHYKLGVPGSFQGRFEKAIPASQSALERNPSLADEHANLGYALEHYRRSVEERPDHRLARCHLKRMLSETGRPAASAAPANPPARGAEVAHRGPMDG